MVRSARFFGVFVASLAMGCGGSSTMAPSGSHPSGPSSPGGVSALTASIGVGDAGFGPRLDSVRVGTVVTWANGGSLDHTVTSDGMLWDSGQIGGMSGGGAYGSSGASPGGSFQRTFASAGTYPYHCSNHVFMTGTIVVTP